MSSGSSSSGGGGRVDAGRHAASGGSGVAISRGGERGNYTVGGRHGDSGATSGGAAATSGASGTAAAKGERAAARSESATGNARTADGLTPRGPSYGRPHGNEPTVGTAVPRGSVPPASRPGGGTIVTSGAGYYYPWWWLGSGAAFYSNCWIYGAALCSNGFGYFGAFGGFSGLGGAPYYGYYDPWFGGYPDMEPTIPSGGSGGSSETFVPVDEGSLRLKIKPKNAEVYVDGFYVGVVDDFDGMFQKLHIETGPHRVEVRAPGYEPLIIEVRISADHATTYQGELKRVQ
jgi:hypothetical protein